jgi:hypothetical protein
MSWREFEEGTPELASLGAELLNKKIAYLATTKKDGAPRVHPVRPFIGEGHFFLFIHRKSPKKRDLLRDGRYALHGSVFESNSLSAEFLSTGVATYIDDPGIRAIAMRLAGHHVPARYTLFKFAFDQVIATEYDEERTPRRRRWSCPR